MDLAIKNETFVWEKKKKRLISPLPPPILEGGGFQIVFNIIFSTSPPRFKLNAFLFSKITILSIPVNIFCWLETRFLFNERFLAWVPPTKWWKSPGDRHFPQQQEFLLQKKNPGFFKRPFFNHSHDHKKPKNPKPHFVPGLRGNEETEVHCRQGQEAVLEQCHSVALCSCAQGDALHWSSEDEAPGTCLKNPLVRLAKRRGVKTQYPGHVPIRVIPFCLPKIAPAVSFGLMS